MENDNHHLTVVLDADTSAFKAQIEEATRIGDRFATSLTSAFLNITKGGTTLETQLKKVALSLSNMAFKAAFKPLENAFSGFVNSAFSGAFGFASGATLAKGTPVPFAKGGIVSSPSLFPLASGRTGLMGEAGPEAIMPLARGADGRLGVRASGAASAPSITFNVTTPDAQSFLKSESQVAAMLARAVSSGQRNL